MTSSWRASWDRFRAAARRAQDAGAIDEDEDDVEDEDLEADVEAGIELEAAVEPSQLTPGLAVDGADEEDTDEEP